MYLKLIHEEKRYDLGKLYVYKNFDFGKVFKGKDRILNESMDETAWWDLTIIRKKSDLEHSSKVVNFSMMTFTYPFQKFYYLTSKSCMCVIFTGDRSGARPSL
jgi:hypothetical protein